MKNSIYIKSIIFFLLILFISNALMVIVFISSFNNSVTISNEDYIEESAVTVKKLYNYGMDTAGIIDSSSNNRSKVLIYDSYEVIEHEYTAQINLIDKTRIEQDEEVLIKQNDMFVIFKLGDKYCIIYPLNTGGPITIKMAVIVSALITICVATFIVFLGVGTFMKPLISLSVAARAVAEGRYDVSVEVRENKDAIGQLVDDFNAMSKKLFQTEMLRNDFVSSISHEFKTPIQSIYGFANLLLDETTNETHRDYLSSICQEAERLSALSANILQLNRLDNMINIGEFDSYDLAEQIRQSVLVLEKKWTDKNIDMNIELDEVKITAQKDMMKQVFINLLDNAIKFTPQNGKIDILLYKDKDKATVIIHDNGAGIKETEFDRIFEKFYKGDSSRNSSGNGLGLAIVKKILNLHSFSIKVANALTGGAEFTISIPL